jgi:hypothetical protein
VGQGMFWRAFRPIGSPRRGDKANWRLGGHVTPQETGPVWAHASHQRTTFESVALVNLKPRRLR